MKRTWTQHSKINSTKAQKTALANAIDRMEWVSPKSQLSMSSAYVVAAMISEFDIPNVSAVSGDGRYSVLGRAYNLIGVEGNYSDGRVRVYAIDDGSKLIPIATDFWSNEARSNPKTLTEAPVNWVLLDIKLPQYYGGFSFKGYVPRWVKTGVLGKGSHKQQRLAMQWLQREQASK